MTPNQNQLQQQPATPPAQEIPDLMYIHAAARLLQCSKRHVYQLIANGELEAHRLGKVRGLRVTKTSVAAYAAQTRVDHTEYYE